MMTTVVRHALKHLTLISDNSPNATHNIIIKSEVGVYETQSKTIGSLDKYNNKRYRRLYRIQLYQQSIAHNVQKFVELILNELSFILTQMTYTLQIIRKKIGNYDLRGEIITRFSKQPKIFMVANINSKLYATSNSREMRVIK